MIRNLHITLDGLIDNEDYFWWKDNSEYSFCYKLVAPDKLIVAVRKCASNVRCSELSP